jgi:hypothetical protein
MNDLAHITNKIIKFIYVQPEVSVSIEKILKKFKWLNRDDLELLLKKMDEDNYVELSPKSSFALETVGTSDDGSYKESKDNKTSTLIPVTHVSLTLKGKDNAEEQHALLLRAHKEFYARPLINSLISAIVGFLLGYFFQSM